MGVSVQIDSEIAGIKFEAAGLKKLVRSVCRRFKVSDAAINIVITGDEQIRRLNKKYLKSSCNTDCLSFNLYQGDYEGVNIFEFVLNGQEARKQARKRGHTTQAELALYILHCMLHNLGFDDTDRQQWRRMHKLEDEILQQQGFGVVFNKPKK